MENENGKSENKFWGVVVYEIVNDKCLTGLWTNNDPEKNGALMNEIARKRHENGNISDYDVSWIEPNQEPTIGKLKITHNKNVYDFEWFVGGKPIFKGIGMQVGPKQLVAFYCNADDTFCI